MLTVDIHDAKTNLSELLERATTQGESFIIAWAGKPLVKVVPIEQGDRPQRRIGFMAGRITVADDWKDLGHEELEGLFQGEG